VSKDDAPSRRDRWAWLRHRIIAELLEQPPEHGELQRKLRELAGRIYVDPFTRHPTTFGYSTIERWFYAAREAQNPVLALTDALRSHAGRHPSMTPTAIAVLTALYDEHPSWSMEVHHINLVAELGEKDPSGQVPSYSSVRRYMKKTGLVRQHRPKRDTEGARAAAERLQSHEVRSYETDHVGALWHADFHDGSRKIITEQGQWIVPQLLCVMDDHSRLVCHLQWYTNEETEDLVHGLSQALQRRGLPRRFMTDNGSAMKGGEFLEGLARLGIEHDPTLEYSPYQNGKLERFWGIVEGQLMAMLETVPDEDITLDLLNEATAAWIEEGYNQKPHSEIRTTPVQRYLNGGRVLRDCPSSDELRNAFRIQVQRSQRHQDGSISIDAQRFEIDNQYRHLEKVHVRYARWDLRRVDMVDPRTGTILCRLRPQDKSANADGERRRRVPLQTDLRPAPPSTGIAPALRKMMQKRAATGLPPAYLPRDPDDSEENT
jgi:putative transposase